VSLATGGHPAHPIRQALLSLEVHDGPADHHRLHRRPRALPLPPPRPHDAFWNEVDKVLPDFRERKEWLRELSKTEKPKLEKLKPHRYVLAVSNSLSRTDKKAIQHALSPYVVSECDIYGKEDLNDLLKGKTHIERRHYKLWLHSASVLGHIFNNAIIGRSAFSIEEIMRSSARYVVTANHNAALKILEGLHVVIITGAPGIGKTTLADHLCLHYVAQGFDYLKIADDIREAEAVFDADSKQVIYFDDFLGRNYLDALKGHEGNQVTQFIRRIATNKNKRFILTSRSTILNQGKLLIDSFEHNNVQKNEYELRIQSLTELDKAQILYNHIWHSGLENEYVEQLYLKRRYRDVIAHRNFNPRLISYITDPTRLETCPPADYWDYIVQSLTNPSQIWENPFIAQQDDFGRAIILLVVLNGNAIGENVLSAAYHRFIALPENQNLHGRQEFLSNIRLLTGSFLKRIVTTRGEATIDLFNPSIGDYVLRRYSGQLDALRLGMLSLQNPQSLITLRSLRQNELLSEAHTLSVCDALINDQAENDFEGASVSYVSTLCAIYKACRGLAHVGASALRTAVLFIINEGQGAATDVSFGVVQWAFENHIVNVEQALKFAADNIEVIDTDDEIQAISSLLLAIPEATPGYAVSLKNLSEHVIEVIADNLSEFIEVEEAFSQAGYGDYDVAKKELEKLTEGKLNELGVAYCVGDVDRILDCYDMEYEMDKYFHNSYERDDREAEGPAILAIDEIDDLFDRG
jgi:adenylate kinase family enzyme